MESAKHLKVLMQISFIGALFLVFLVLKLTGVIAWSWIWITAPLWGAVAMTIAFLFFCLLALWVTNK